MKNLLGSAFLLAAITAPAYAQTPSGTLDGAGATQQLKTLLALPFANDLVGASKVQRFAWVEKHNGVRNILVSDAGAVPKQITHYTQDDGTDIWGLALSPDGSTVAYVEGGDPEYPDDPSPNPDLKPVETRQLVHVISASGKDTIVGEGCNPTFSSDGKMIAYSRKGTLYLGVVGKEIKPVLTQRGSIVSLQWSPDKTRLLFTLDRDTHSIIGLWSVKESKVSFLDPALAQDMQPEFSPDGHAVAFVRTHSPVTYHKNKDARFWSLQIYNLDTGKNRTVWTPSAGHGAKFWSAEGSGLLWADNTHVLFPWEGSGWLRVCSVAIDGGQNTPTCLTPDQAEVSSYRLSADRKSLFYTSNAGNVDKWHAWRVGLDGAHATRLSNSADMETDLAVAGNDVAVIAASANQPAHVVVVAKEQPPKIPVDTQLPSSVHLVTPQDVQFKSADGIEVHGQLFRPAGTQSDKHPALVFVHGGPHRQMLAAFNSMGYYSNAYAMNQTLAAQGYVVLSVNYRSGTGYGEAFRNAPEIGRAGASEYRDVLAGATYLKTLSDVDPHRIGIWGGSWGGYLTALALARNSDIFRSGADFHGVHDMTRTDKMGLSPSENKAAHDLEWQSSPVADIAHWHAPVLLVHGDDDYNVEFSQSTLLARMLSEQGVNYEEHSFPNERHAFLRMQDWLTAYQWTNAFFARTLKDSQP